MRILGIDPGLAIVGFGIIDFENNAFKPIEYGQVNSPANTPIPKRIKMLYDDITFIMNKYNPASVAIEELFFNNNQKTAISVAMARGALVLAAENANIPTFEYTPLQVKQAVVGYGRADKNQIQQMVKIMLNLHEIPSLTTLRTLWQSQFATHIQATLLETLK